MSLPIIIVGGGFAGVATAWHLVRSNPVPVVILERDPACGDDRVCVASIDVVVCAAFTPAFAVVECERDANLRAMHGASIAI